MIRTIFVAIVALTLLACGEGEPPRAECLPRGTYVGTKTVARTSGESACPRVGASERLEVDYSADGDFKPSGVNGTPEKCDAQIHSPNTCQVLSACGHSDDANGPFIYWNIDARAGNGGLSLTGEWKVETHACREAVYSMDGQKVR